MKPQAGQDLFGDMGNVNQVNSNNFDMGVKRQVPSYSNEGQNSSDNILEMAKNRADRHYSKKEEGIRLNRQKKQEFLDKFEKACRYFDAENRAAQQNISKILWVFLLITIVIVFAFIKFFSSIEQNKIFCDTGMKVDNCEPCPTKAFCSGGKISFTEKILAIKNEFC